ncbi:MAG: FAD-dependent oxidoreductase [Eubacteriales bacterium]|nr:FAD-dependent oxidoreductase [Eubacteriales bacterium]
MENTKVCTLAVIGGGPAGLAAALAAKEAGCTDILILERDKALGGILNQCIHNGFGLHTFQEELTGPEYAARFIERVREAQIPGLLNTMVLDIAPDRDGKWVLTAMNREEGLFTLRAETVILAMGCRERPRGALNIPGFRPAGVYSAGTAQRLVNIEGFLPGREAVILGSGDIGLIMARRLTLEGAKVKAVAELMPYSGGLRRNIVQCLEDYGIPLLLSTTVTQVHGKERVEGVTLSRVDETRRPIPGTEQFISCDTLLLSVGLIPENELSEKAGVAISPVTGGPLVDESMETSKIGIFACGNVLHVHDLVDYVSQEAAKAGTAAARYVLEGEKSRFNAEKGVIVVCGRDGVRYTVPSRIHRDRMEEELLIRFRVGDVYRNRYLSVYFDEKRVLRRKKRVMAPGEMEQLILKKEELLKYGDVKEIILCTEEE